MEEGEEGSGLQCVVKNNSYTPPAIMIETDLHRDLYQKESERKEKKRLAKLHAQAGTTDE